MVLLYGFLTRFREGNEFFRNFNILSFWLMIKISFLVNVDFLSFPLSSIIHLYYIIKINCLFAWSCSCIVSYGTRSCIETTFNTDMGNYTPPALSCPAQLSPPLTQLSQAKLGQAERNGAIRSLGGKAVRWLPCSSSVTSWWRLVWWHVVWCGVLFVRGSSVLQYTSSHSHVQHYFMLSDFTS